MAKRRDRFESPGSEEALEAEDEAKEAIRESVEANTGYEPEFEEEWSAQRRLDLNTASEQELQELPGIGPELAAEIVAYREERGGFREPAEITGVPGITADVYNGLADRVTTGADLADEYVVEEGVILPAEARSYVEEEPPPIPEEPELAEEEVAVVSEPEPLDEEVTGVDEAPRAEEVPPAPPPPPTPVRVTTPPPRGGVGWLPLLLVGLLSAIAGALLALLVLWLLNGTLDMQQSAERRLRNEVFRLEGDMEAIRAQVGGVEDRITGVESLAADVEQARSEIRNLQRSTDSLQGEIDTATQRLDDLQAGLAGLSDDMVNVEESVTTLGTQLQDVEARVGTMAEELAEAQEAVSRFDAFLEGLRALLLDTSTGGMGTSVPMLQTMTPLPTSTRRPDVTVIPLATRTPTTP